MAVLLVLSLAAVACIEGNRAAWVRNQTAQPIHVNQVIDRQEELLVSLDTPFIANDAQFLLEKSGRFAEGCSLGPLLAKDSQGEEVARLEEELCIDDIWVIDPQGNSSVQRG